MVVVGRLLGMRQRPHATYDVQHIPGKPFVTNALPRHFRPLDCHGRHSTWSLVYESPVLHEPIAIDISWLPTDSLRPDHLPAWLCGLLPAVGRCIDAITDKFPRDERVAFVMRSAITLWADRLCCFLIEVCTEEGVFWEIVIDDTKFPGSCEVSCLGGDYLPSRDYLGCVAAGHSLLDSQIPDRYWSD